MTLRRLEMLQWVGLFLGGVAWFSYHLAGWGLTEARCDSGGFDIDHDVWQAVLMSAAAALVAVAGLAAVAVLLRTRETTYDGDPPPGRIRFVALAAAASNLLFLMIVLLDGLGSIFNVACRQG